MRKLVSKGPDFRKAISTSWNKCKREIEIGLDSAIERIISANPTEESAEWKRKILQEDDNKIISLKHQIKVHETFASIDEAANNIVKSTISLLF